MASTDDLKLYDAKSVHISLDGRVLTRFQTGDMISIQQKEANITTEVDAQGEASVAINNNKLADATINMSGNSSDIAFLNDLANSHKCVPFVCDSDLEKITAAQAFVSKPAPVAFGKDTPKRAYTIELLSMITEVK
ncbi:phage structural protein [Loigolactobacillus bifermentans]|nr:hypothetical protein [Loigolactobacillus bifermentans]QGG59549.1 hypothetical protein LB003_03115 [Loigolactobacillus bifermentans]